MNKSRLNKKNGGLFYVEKGGKRADVPLGRKWLSMLMDIYNIRGTY